MFQWVSTDFKGFNGFQWVSMALGLGLSWFPKSLDLSSSPALDLATEALDAAREFMEDEEPGRLGSSCSAIPDTKHIC